MTGTVRPRPFNAGTLSVYAAYELDLHEAWLHLRGLIEQWLRFDAVELIDAAENNELTYANVKHAEVAKFYSYTRHLMLPDYLLINPKVLDAMPEDVRKIFLEEIAIAVKVCHCP